MKYSFKAKKGAYMCSQLIILCIIFFCKNINYFYLFLLFSLVYLLDIFVLLRFVLFTFLILDVLFRLTSKKRYTILKYSLYQSIRCKCTPRINLTKDAHVNCRFVWWAHWGIFNLIATLSADNYINVQAVNNLLCNFVRYTHNHLIYISAR